MKALKITGKQKAEVVSDAAKPSVREGYILVRVEAVALNPTDWKHIGFVSTTGVTVGCDYAGVVEAVGSGIHKQWQVGDRVCGVVHGANESQSEDGAFGEYLVAKGDLQIRIPEEMSFEAAATLGMGVSTVGQGMYQALALPLPSEPTKEKFTVLIYGGSSAMGSYGIQYGVASGLDIITTASERNFDHVKSIGASAAFDYKSSTCGADIRKHTDNKLEYAWDAIGEGDAPKICGEALADPAPPGVKLQYANVLRGKVPRDDVQSMAKLMYTTFGEEFSKGGTVFPASQDDFDFMKLFITISEKLIADGKVKPHNYEVRSGGLDGILSGLGDMRDGKISATKLVYKIKD